MEVFTKVTNTAKRISELKQQGKTIGFVPTMGALHEGHLSLMRKAKEENDVLAVSIFVNPIQFNNKEDLEKYPRDIYTDIKMLEEVDCDILFAPDEKEMYPGGYPSEKFDFGNLEKVMEGKFRPGHFNGVAIVVKRLFEIIKPDKAYFGKKDFQQLAIIKKMVKTGQIPVEIIPCEIIREDDGLAMSSRNKRLSAKERDLAPLIYKILSESVTKKDDLSPAGLKKWVTDELGKIKEFEIEYFEIADGENLMPVDSWDDSKEIRGFIAVYLGDVRLIDNIRYT